MPRQPFGPRALVVSIHSDWSISFNANMRRHVRDHQTPDKKHGKLTFDIRLVGDHMTMEFGRPDLPYSLKSMAATSHHSPAITKRIKFMYEGYHLNGTTYACEVQYFEPDKTYLITINQDTLINTSRGEKDASKYE